MANPAGYPSVEDVMNLARVLLNDAFAGANGTPGEGRIFTDSSPQALPALNNAIRSLELDLEDANVPTTREEEVLLSVPAINSTATGGAVGQGDPTLQQILSFTGFFDGSVQLSSPVLPGDMGTPNEIWQRASGSGNTLAEVSKAAGALPSYYQGPNLLWWEWRANQIVWNGATQPLDIRIRYTAGLAPITVAPANFPTTYIPVLHCLNALAYLTAYNFSMALTPSNAQVDYKQDYETEVNRLIQRNVRLMQMAPTSRQAYGDSGDLFGWFG